MDALLQDLELQPVRPGHDHFAVDHTLRRHGRQHRLHHLGEVAGEGTFVAASELHLGAVPEDDAPEPVPLGLVQKLAHGQLPAQLGQHRGDGGHDRQVHGLTLGALTLRTWTPSWPASPSCSHSRWTSWARSRAGCCTSRAGAAWTASTSPASTRLSVSPAWTTPPTRWRRRRNWPPRCASPTGRGSSTPASSMPSTFWSISISMSSIREKGPSTGYSTSTDGPASCTTLSSRAASCIAPNSTRSPACSNPPSARSSAPYCALASPSSYSTSGSSGPSAPGGPSTGDPCQSGTR